MNSAPWVIHGPGKCILFWNSLNIKCYLIKSVLINSSVTEQSTEIKFMDPCITDYLFNDDFKEC